MSDYQAISRTNYFQVEDVEAFKEFCNKYDFTFISNEHGVGFYVDDTLPTHDPDLEDTEIDLTEIIGSMLVPGQTAIITEAGHEGMRYTNGYAMAVHKTAEGELKFTSISTGDIWQKAIDEFGLTEPPTEPSY